jgi:transposase
MAAPRKYPVELQERAVRLWRSEQPRRPIAHLARELGVHPEACGTGSARTRPTAASELTG